MQGCGSRRLIRNRSCGRKTPCFNQAARSGVKETEQLPNGVAGLAVVLGRYQIESLRPSRCSWCSLQSDGRDIRTAVHNLEPELVPDGRCALPDIRFWFLAVSIVCQLDMDALMVATSDLLPSLGLQDPQAIASQFGVASSSCLQFPLSTLRLSPVPAIFASQTIQRVRLILPHIPEQNQSLSAVWRSIFCSLPQ